MDQHIAVIDLGTNTFHLLIAAIKGTTVEILHREKVPVKLGLAGINQGMITQEAIARGRTCLMNFHTVLQQWGVSHCQGFGTSALRSARNGSEVLAYLRKETGMDLVIISGDEEAAFICHGVRAAVPLGHEKSLIIDIGGGSVEFIIADQNTLYWKQSIEMGAQRLLELYHRHDPILSDEIAALEKHFDKFLTTVRDAIHLHKPAVLVGSSGTFDTLSEIYCAEQGIPFSGDSPETPFSISAFKPIHQLLISKTRAERLLIPGMIEMRVDMIVVASCLIDYMLRHFPITQIRVSSWSLKEGVLTQWLASEPGR
jgi:exopolyphosphatase/guanosine-5'-triphosphate,3'-diphosphate pyrophosphatase